jgi:hypothetical protein
VTTAASAVYPTQSFIAMLIGALQVPLTGNIFAPVAEPLAAAPPAEAGAIEPAAEPAAELAGAAGAADAADAAALATGVAGAELLVWFTFAAQALVISNAAAVRPTPNRLAVEDFCKRMCAPTVSGTKAAELGLPGQPGLDTNFAVRWHRPR